MDQETLHVIHAFESHFCPEELDEFSVKEKIMAYIANTYIEDKKKLKKELKKIHGIGFGKMKLLNAIFNTKKESYWVKKSNDIDMEQQF